MAHHQGMSIVALANVLRDNVAQRWGMANAHVQAVSSLLHERVPREIPVLQDLPVAMQTPLQRRRNLPHLLPPDSCQSHSNLIDRLNVSQTAPIK